MQQLQNPRLIRWLVGLVIVISAVVAFSFYQSRSNTSPRPALPTKILSAPTLPPPTPIKPTLTPTVAPVSLKVAIDKIKIVTTIIELYYDRNIDGWNVSTLNRFAGHLQGTPTFGQGGNAVLAGHVELKDGSAGAFAKINTLVKGDHIFILSDDPKKPVIMQYTVTSIKVVDPNAVDEIRDHGYEELTLITCQEYDFKTSSYQKRVVVHAQPTNAKTTKTFDSELLPLNPSV